MVDSFLRLDRVETKGHMCCQFFKVRWVPARMNGNGSLPHMTYILVAFARLYLGDTDGKARPANRPLLL